MGTVRLNRFIASTSNLSRRGADQAIAEGRVRIDGRLPQVGEQVSDQNNITLDGRPLQLPAASRTVLFNKPVGVVVSRDGQGSRTIFDILPADLQQLQPVGRLDKYSSGLLLLTNDGDLAQRLTHPRYEKVKMYQVTLARPLAPLHRQMIGEFGVQLDDGPSKLGLERQRDGDDTAWIVTMHEGRNRQIRRTFMSLGYNVTRLHRTVFGDYKLPENLRAGSFIEVGTQP